MLTTIALITTLAAVAAPTIDQPLKTGNNSPDDVAIVIGIEDYAFIGDVPYAARDAKAFYDFLLYTRGVPPSRIRLLDSSPNREQILQALDEMVALSNEESTVWVYFAGHGAASPTTTERILLGVDVQADLVSFEARAVTMAELRDKASEGGRQAILILDTCYTGQGRTGEALLEGKRFAVPSYAVTESARILEWSAASANEFSGPFEPVQHGAFTYFTIGALRGWADGQIDGTPDGTVTAVEADIYIQEALRAVQITDQRPVMQGGEDWTLMVSGRLEAAPNLSAVALVAPVSEALPAATIVTPPAVEVAIATTPAVEVDFGIPDHVLSAADRVSTMGIALVRLGDGSNYMSATEITKGQYRAVMGELPRRAALSDAASLPVYDLMFAEAVTYCNKLSEMEGLQPVYSGSMTKPVTDPEANGYRLPISSEWAAAANAGEKHRYSGGNKPDGYVFTENAVGCRRYDDTWEVDPGACLQPVATMMPNGWGLYDMTGNIHEWVIPDNFRAGYAAYKGGNWVLLAKNKDEWGWSITDEPTGQTLGGGFRVIRRVDD